MDTWEDYIRRQQEEDGVRSSWNEFPLSHADSLHVVAPFYMLYSPLQERPADRALPHLNYPPVVCATCTAILNPLCYVDYREKAWKCVMCNKHNQFPSHFPIAEDNLPPELYPQFTTIEYSPMGLPSPPIFLFVIDKNILSAEMDALKVNVLTSLCYLPPNTLVGIISYGSMIKLHCLTSHGVPINFRADIESSMQCVSDQIMMQDTVARSIENSRNLFMKPISDCNEIFSEIIEKMKRSTQMTEGRRPLRATGAAISVALSVIEACYPSRGSRIMGFIGGPCTQGPGMVASDLMSHEMRSSVDLTNSPYYAKAIEFYECQSERAVKNGSSVDLMICCDEDAGLAEMKSLLGATGGSVVRDGSFASESFSHNVIKLFLRDEVTKKLPIGFNGTIEVRSSEGLNVDELIGLFSREVHTVKGSVASTVWRVNSLSSRTTLCFILKISAEHDTIPPDERAYIQFVTRYQDIDGHERIRVTTSSRRWVKFTRLTEILDSFDSNAAVTGLARESSFHIDDGVDVGRVVRWMDDIAYKMCVMYGDSGESDEFVLPEKVVRLAHSIFYLRKSCLIQIMKYSPDEGVSYRQMLSMENVAEMMSMIQPVLYSYSCYGPPENVVVDATSILNDDRILMLSDFFHIIVFHGDTILSWLGLNYHLLPQYASFSHILKSSCSDADSIRRGRRTMPLMISTQDNPQKARRFLLSKVDPSIGEDEQNLPAIVCGYGELSTFISRMKNLAKGNSN